MAVTMLGGLLGVVVMLAFVIPVALYFAWAASILWGWFIVPTFGAPPLTVLQMWGICLTLGMLRPRLDMKKADTDGWASGLLAALVGPPVSIALGAAIKFWWM